MDHSSCFHHFWVELEMRAHQKAMLARDTIMNNNIRDDRRLSMPEHPYNPSSEPEDQLVPLHSAQGHPEFFLPQQCPDVSRPATPARAVHPTRDGQQRTTPLRLSKVEALAFVHRCKQWLVVGSLVAFGVLTGLVAGHVIGTASPAATPSPHQAGSTPSSSPSSTGDFFQQQGGNSFGNGTFGQQPVSGSHTS